jgi:hypothetical protein
MPFPLETVEVIMEDAGLVPLVNPWSVAVRVGRED